MIVLGIDPGLTGAWALVRDKHLLTLGDLPTVEFSAGRVKRKLDGVQFALMVRNMCASFCEGEDLVACVEKVFSMPGQGVSSMFSLGMSAGIIEGVLAAERVPIHWTTPSAWTSTQRAGRDKGHSVPACNANWPGMAANWTLKKHHNRCDAALIAKHGWEVLA